MHLTLLALALSPTTPTAAPLCPVTEMAEAAIAAKLGAGRALVFCAPHEKPIRRVEGFRDEWLKQAGHPELVASCRPGQFFTFQIGVLARRDVASVKLDFGDLKGPHGAISAKLARCLSLGGTDMDGKPFGKALSIGVGRLQPLWCGWDVPKDAKGAYTGTAVLELGPNEVHKVSLRVDVAGSPVEDWGADDPNALTRLRWLDSKAGAGDWISPPFTPATVADKTIHVLGRDLELAQTGLPSSILSHFSDANTSIHKQGRAVLARPMSFLVEDEHGAAPLTAKLSKISASKVGASWKASGTAGGFDAMLSGRVDYTGSGSVSIRLTAKRDMVLRDIRLEVPYAPGSAKYMMGLNRQGGLRLASHSWKWDTSRQQDCFWLGDVNAGLMLRLKGSNYRRPLLNIYYSFCPLNLPDSWGNGGLGGVQIAEEPGCVVARAYSGPRRVKRGETLEFTADFYMTPFRTIDTEKQWSTRFIHPQPTREPKPIDDALAMTDPVHGPNVVNVHQANFYNPYINYPYSPDSFGFLADIVKRAHDKGVRARVYYTTREVTQNMPELYALHALNGEMVFPGPGKDAKTLIHPDGPDQWLVDNLGSDFIPAWLAYVGGKFAEKDISVITTPDSRWNNFYLEGLKWMVDKAQLDGVYIDDTALNASSLRRARRILSARPNPVIDLHSWNHFNEYAGLASNLNLYMEVLPYLDRLWLGEGFSANAAPLDYWLVEMSGLPFGLMSEMLDSPNVARGLVFGETGRLGWSGDPRPVWKAFDTYGIQGTEMIPFFVPGCPVSTGNPEVPATVYRGKGYALVAIASWASHPVDIRLQIDWKALGLDAANAEILMPEVAGMQSERELSLAESLKIQPGSGYLLVLRRRQ